MNALSADAPLMAERAADQVRVIVVDRRRLIGDALAALIAHGDGFTVVDAVTPEDAVRSAAVHKPDLLVFGVGRDTLTALAHLREIRGQAPDIEIVMVADSLDPELVRFTINEGGGGLILSDLRAGDIAGCLDQVAHGRAVLPAGWRGVLSAEHDDVLDALSKRQMEVLKLLADGCSYEEIASSLFISVNTVKFHVRSIFARLGVRNRMAAAHILSRRS